MSGIGSSRVISRAILESKISEIEQTNPDVDGGKNLELVDLKSELNKTSLFNAIFPPDVVSEIFNLVKETQDTSDFSSLPVPFVLGSVCRTWRETVRSDTRLWDTIIIRLSASKFAVQEELLQDWLIRSGQLRPLYCYITFRNGNSIWKPPVSFAKLILEASSRWRVFECSPNIPSLSQELQRPGIDFSSLVKLKIYHSLCSKLDFSGASRLQHLVITDQKIRQVTLLVNWKQLTSLDISQMIDMPAAIEIVQMLVGIQHLSLDLGYLFPSSYGVRTPGQGPPPRKLLSLSHLSLQTSMHPPLISMFFDAITSPALTQVTLSFGDGFADSWGIDDDLHFQEAFYDFLRRSAFTLEKFMISPQMNESTAKQIAFLIGLTMVTFDYTNETIEMRRKSPQKLL